MKFWPRSTGTAAEDAKISDILVNDKDHVFIEKGGLLQRVDTTFATIAICCRSSTASYRGWGAEWMSPRRWWMPAARRLSRQCHYSTAGARRTFLVDPPLRDRSAGRQSACSVEERSAEMMEVLSSAVKARISILIAGGTGAGKTTF